MKRTLVNEALRPLPVAVQPRPDECGLGFMLRAAVKNGLSLGKLNKWIDGASLFDASEAVVARRAYVLQVPPAWLACRLPRRTRQSDVATWCYLQHDWIVPAAFRTAPPQICPSCIHEAGYCRAVWRLSAYVACPRHKLVLTSQCAHCRRPLQWDRPAVDVCQCGRHVALGSEVPTATTWTMAWSLWLEHRMNESLQPNVQDTAVPGWFDILSVDAAVCLVHLAGVLSRDHEIVPAFRARLPKNIDAMAALVDRGLARLSDVDPDDPTSLRAIAGVLYEPGLRRLVQRGLSYADRLLADRWLEWALDRPPFGNGIIGRKRQLDLF